VAEESNEERKVDLDLLDEVREEARLKSEVLKRRVQYKYNSKLKASPVPGRRPGDAEGPPLLAREQVVPQVDWSFQSDRGPWEWSLQA